MELSSHCEYFDFNDEKDLVNMFGGVAYDHDSMPKMVAVHTLSPEKVNNQHGSIIERLPRNIIGIRRNPKKSRDFSIQRSCVDFREQENSVKNLSFGLDQISQSHSQHKTTLPGVTDAISVRKLEKISSPCHKTVTERTSKPQMNFNSSCERNFQEKELGCEYINKNVDSGAVTEVFSVAEKLSLPCEFNTESVTFSDDCNTKNGSLECLDWFSIGVLAGKQSPEKLNLNWQLCSRKGETAGKNNHEGKITEGLNYGNIPNSLVKLLKVDACSKFGSLDNVEVKTRCQETSRNTGGTAGRPSEEKHMEGIDNHWQKQTRDCLIPRKRPRKSIPRKIDIKSEHFCCGSHSTDSEETLSADEITSELSPNKCTSVVSPNSSSRSDSISPKGTKVIFRRTAGVWSVSTLISDVQEDKGSAGSSNRESYAQNDKPSKNICLFADRQRAPLVICDSLDSNCKEHCYSPALDREMRIKELKRKREKLLADVGQSRAAASQTNL